MSECKVIANQSPKKYRKSIQVQTNFIKFKQIKSNSIKFNKFSEISNRAANAFKTIYIHSVCIEYML